MESNQTYKPVCTFDWWKKCNPIIYKEIDKVATEENRAYIIARTLSFLEEYVNKWIDRGEYPPSGYPLTLLREKIQEIATEGKLK